MIIFAVPHLYLERQIFIYFYLIFIVFFSLPFSPLMHSSLHRSPHFTSMRPSSFSSTPPPPNLPPSTSCRLLSIYESRRTDIYYCVPCAFRKVTCRRFRPTLKFGLSYLVSWASLPGLLVLLFRAAISLSEKGNKNCLIVLEKIYISYIYIPYIYM